MTQQINTEWSGHHVDKDTLRSEIWTKLKENDISFRDPAGHIPTFVGSDDAAERLAELPIWQEARVIKSNPDTAHIPLRLRALQDGKRLYMAVPRLTTERCFIELTADDLRSKGVALEDAAAWQGAMEHGKYVSLDEMEPIDLVLVGCVAVSREGGRIGKGAGFADLELGMLREVGLIQQETPIVAAVHPIQIVDNDRLPMDAHDSPLNWIITPDEVIATNTPLPQPAGLDWDRIRPEQYDQIPILRKLRGRLTGA